MVSSRTYVSALERGIKMPTINKVVELSEVCGVHPLTLLVLSFCRDAGQAEIQRILSTISQELEALEPVDL